MGNTEWRGDGGRVVSFGGMGEAEARPFSGFLRRPLTLQTGLRAGLVRLLRGRGLLAGRGADRPALLRLPLGYGLQPGSVLLPSGRDGRGWGPGWDQGPASWGVSGREWRGRRPASGPKFLEGGDFPGRRRRAAQRPGGGLLGVGREDYEPVTAVFLGLWHEGQPRAPLALLGQLVEGRDCPVGHRLLVDVTPPSPISFPCICFQARSRYSCVGFPTGVEFSRFSFPTRVSIRIDFPTRVIVVGDFPASFSFLCVNFPNGVDFPTGFGFPSVDLPVIHLRELGRREVLLLTLIPFL